MDRHAATRRLRQLAQQASVTITRPHPHMLRHFRDDYANAGVECPFTGVRSPHAGHVGIVRRTAAGACDGSGNPDARRQRFDVRRA
jgi:hypothetical protein